MSAQDETCSETKPQQDHPGLCKNGCGFFSSADAEGFCSVCYKDLLKQRSTHLAASLSNLSVTVEKEEGAEVNKEQIEVGENNIEEQEKEAKKSRKNRCASCGKKIGLTGFPCRCGGMYCGIHRYSDKHRCDFDYKARGRVEIATANPVIVAEKVARI